MSSCLSFNNYKNVENNKNIVNNSSYEKLRKNFVGDIVKAYRSGVFGGRWLHVWEKKYYGTNEKINDKTVKKAAEEFFNNEITVGDLEKHQQLNQGKNDNQKNTILSSIQESPEDSRLKRYAKRFGVFLALPIFSAVAAVSFALSVPLKPIAWIHKKITKQETSFYDKFWSKVGESTKTPLGKLVLVWAYIGWSITSLWPIFFTNNATLDPNDKIGESGDTITRAFNLAMRSCAVIDGADYHANNHPFKLNQEGKAAWAMIAGWMRDVPLQYGVTLMHTIKMAAKFVTVAEGTVELIDKLVPIFSFVQRFCHTTLSVAKLCFDIPKAMREIDRKIVSNRFKIREKLKELNSLVAQRFEEKRKKLLDEIENLKKEIAEQQQLLKEKKLDRVKTKANVLMGTIGLITSGAVVALAVILPGVSTAALAVMRFLDQCVWLTFIVTLTTRKIGIYKNALENPRGNSFSIVDDIVKAKKA